MAEEQVNKPRLIIIGGSSGSLDAAIQFLPKLKPGFNIPILMIMHRNSQSDNTLADLLSFKTFLTVKEAEDKELMQPGYLYIAPADYHVLIEDDNSLSLDASEKVHFCRPSIDVSFSSAADVYKQDIVAILLSGANADGADGMARLKMGGAVTIIQNPEEALVSYMPMQALAAGAAGKILPAHEIAGFLNGL